MAEDTWDRIAAHVVTRFPHAVRESARAVRFVAVLDGGRAGIRLRATSAYGANVVMMTADLGAIDSIDPWLGLSLNAQLASGALAIDNETLVLRTLIEDGVSNAEVERRLALLAHEATKLKAELSLPPRAAPGFDHYAD